MTATKRQLLPGLPLNDAFGFSPQKRESWTGFKAALLNAPVISLRHLSDHGDERGMGRGNEDDRKEIRK